MVIATAGRRTDAPGAERRFPAENTQLVADRLRRVFEAESATAVVSSAACGADLLAQREAAALGLQRRVVLPFDPVAFRASSVVDRPGDWGPLFDETIKTLQASGSVTTLNGAVGDDGAYAAANAAILDVAAALAKQTDEELCALIVWEGASRGDGDLTNAFADAARARGLRVIEVLTLHTCFVVQGFGEKTDLSTGRVLNLDASYDVIKEAVQEAGLHCVRADEIIHSGTIEKPMYEWLFRADLVIADLSTYNVNAAYELGVRYGLRPGATMIVAEREFKNPFDVGHIVTLGYEHLGKDVGRLEAKRFKKVLVERIKALMRDMKADSPVYGTYLMLRPPVEIAQAQARKAAAGAARAGTAPAAPTAAPADPAAPPPVDYDASAKQLLAKAREALAADRFLEAKGLFFALHAMLPRDTFVIQQLALATYKSKSPDAVAALLEAHKYLQELRPDATNDPETLGLWGAVHKRLWDAHKQRKDLDEAVASYERGFYLKQDYYNGINLAFLLNVRAQQQRLTGEVDEAIADHVLARRVRRQVLEYCKRALAAGPTSDADKYWIVATQWEAAVGLEDEALAEAYRKDAEAAAVAGWMVQSTQGQLAQLRALIAESGGGSSRPPGERAAEAP